MFLCDVLAAHRIHGREVDLAHLAHAVVHFFPIRRRVDFDFAGFIGDFARRLALCFLCLGRVAIVLLERCLSRGRSRAHSRRHGDGGRWAVETALAFLGGAEMVLDVGGYGGQRGGIAIIVIVGISGDWLGAVQWLEGGREDG